MSRLEDFLGNNCTVSATSQVAVESTSQIPCLSEVSRGEVGQHIGENGTSTGTRRLTSGILCEQRLDYQEAQRTLDS